MITMTKEIENMISSYPKETQDKILQMAWDACCDGQWLADMACYLEISWEDTDPWDGKHDELKTELEFEAVKELVENDFQIK